MRTQRIVLLGIVFCLFLTGVFMLRRQQTDDNILHVCTWSSYFPDAILDKFHKDTGIRVQLSYTSSNEELLAKLKAGATGYDIIQPSDYMVRQLAALSLIETLDHSKLPNLIHLEDFYRHPSYDSDLRHSVPFSWGTTGIAINTAKVQVPENGVSWSLLFNSPDPKHTSLLDDMREVFVGALAMRGHSINTQDESAFIEARKDIELARDKILMFSLEPRPLLVKEEIYIAHIYSTDGLLAEMDNPSVKYFIPKEGGVIWTDNFAISKSSSKSHLAYTFINYFLDPEHMLPLVEQVRIATPNRSVMNKLPKDVLLNPNLYPPPSILATMSFLEDLGKLMPVVNRMWTELKSL